MKNFNLAIFLVSAFIIAEINHSSYAQNDHLWNNKKCAVSLTYDDALNVHLDNAVPLLDSLGLKATFYLSGFFPGFKTRTEEWKAVAAHGHELGNHTLFHPCDGSLPGREWVNPDYDLSDYTVSRMVDEIEMANVLLKSLDGKDVRTFAYPCADMKAGASSYVEGLKDKFIAARNVRSEMENIDSVDLYDIACYMINGEPGEYLIKLVEEAKASNSLIVFLFHGVGGEHSLNVSLEAHKELLTYLAENQDDIWVTPMVDVAEYIRERRN